MQANKTKNGSDERGLEIKTWQKPSYSQSYLRPAFQKPQSTILLEVDLSVCPESYYYYY